MGREPWAQEKKETPCPPCLAMLRRLCACGGSEIFAQCGLAPPSCGSRTCKVGETCCWNVAEKRGRCAETCAAEYKLSREAQDELAYESHRRATAAYDEGFYRDLLVEFQGLREDKQPEEVRDEKAVPTPARRRSGARGRSPTTPRPRGRASARRRRCGPRPIRSSPSS